MNRERTLELLSQSKADLQARFGVTKLALFGSIARDTATIKSDVDVLWNQRRGNQPKPTNKNQPKIHQDVEVRSRRF
jgi:predicted nucleotidyltransferase